mgnify:CR=1 FL=1
MKKTNNKGFSLVELIIVVAIMAVLVGVLAPQYLKYLDKSKKGVDEQMIDNLRQAMTTCYLDPNISNNLSDPTTGASLGSGSGFWTEVYSIMGVSDAAGVKALLKLDPSAGTITYDMAGGKFTIYVNNGKYTGALKIKVD